ncbi:MAG: nucleotide sugar dehydrogenase [Actinomycetota bacterium]|nr:nucleotide sugar dehydrogenase [Actinomycetota bacterium]
MPDVSATTRAPDPVDLVVIGMGYVGLPLAQTAVEAGLSVVGLDVDDGRVAVLSAGRSPVQDVTDAELGAMLRAGFRATTDPACLSVSAAAVICVPTPLSLDGMPDLQAIRATASVIARHLHAGMLVVLESTTYPGTTEEVVQPLLEATGMAVGEDFFLAYSPERIDPGNTRFTVRTTPKIVSGVTRRCQEAATSLYGKLVDRVVPTRGTREAEMAKLLENTYRHVNIALVNEMAVFCDELGIDLWEAIAAASTKPFGFQAFRPGPGVGGHCIPVDPNYLSFKFRSLGYPFRFVELAQEINRRMPAYVVLRAQRLLNDHAKAVRGAAVTLLGVTYKPDVADQRETPARPVGRRLLKLGAQLSFHDPYVREWQLEGRTLVSVKLDEAIDQADLVIVLQAHAAYDFDDIARRSRLILDTGGRVRGPNVERL